MLSSIRIVLVHPSHPGNIGAVARAMKNMGLSQLSLVVPGQFPHKDATVRAAGADDILAQARIVQTLSEAIVDCQQVYGTSARSRSLPWPVCTPKAMAERLISHPVAQAAIVFGRESSGLTNEELALCQHHIHIPTVSEFSSLNLAAAVQVIAYELFATVTAADQSDYEIPQDSPLANGAQIHSFFDHLESVLRQLGFIDPRHPKLLMQRLQRLFQRAHLEEKEIHILRGILSAVEKR